MFMYNILFMNLIYMCIFNQKNYINVFKLLITSISVKSNIDYKTTDILIITSSNFQPTVQKELSSFNLKLYYYILDLHTLFEAGCARLNIFNYENINKYNKILYLENDILINRDLNILFNMEISNEKIYAIENGIIGNEDYGSQFFDFEKYDVNKTAFTTGILFFMRSDSIKILFDNIYLQIVDYIYTNKNNIPLCLDQPFIVYNAMLENKYDNQILKSYIEINPNNVNSDKIIYYFWGDNGYYDSKYDKISSFWGKMNIMQPILFKTNKTKIDDDLLCMIKLKLGSNSTYMFYDNDSIIQFFNDNPIKGFSDIVKRYKCISKGEDKAYLFQYYYLYLNGGFSIDFDIIENNKFNFVIVNPSCHPQSIFGGILGYLPKNEKIKKLLNNFYRKNYYFKEFYKINKYEDTDETNKLLFNHYWNNKITPLIENITNSNDYNHNELNEFDYRVLTAYNIQNKLIRVGLEKDGGYVIANGFEYDLFISCGIYDDICFEEDFLNIHKIKCYAFDGNITSFPHSKNNIKWIQKNISYKNTDRTTNLKEYIQHGCKIFLKMDINGYEFNWIDSMSYVELERFSQIIIKFNMPFDIYRLHILKKLNKTHYIIHIHGNESVCNIHNQKENLMPINIPQIFEVTYINKKLFNTNLEKIHNKYPIVNLDFCHPEQIEFHIPNSDKLIYVGDSYNNNIKIIEIEKKEIFGHNFLNKQDSSWKDTFEFKITNDKLIIKRTDENDGWGQKIIIPIKKKEILIYNGFPFHYEMIGFMLDFCSCYNIDVSIVLKIIDTSWIKLYKLKYNFNVLQSLPSELDTYLFVLILSDDDISFPESIINKNIVCLDHNYKNRRDSIKYHIPITPFKNNEKIYTLPIFNYLNYDTKINLLTKNKRPIISFIGNGSLHQDMDELSIINNIDDFDIYIINRNIPENYIKSPNVSFFKNVSGLEIFELLTSSTYICYIPNNTNNPLLQKEYCGISSIPISFTTGCKLILPIEINKFLKLTSIIEYSFGSKLILDKNPSLLETFKEREKLSIIRDNSIFNLDHMKLFLEHKYTNWNDFKKSEIDNFDYRILSTYKIPNKLIRLGPKEDGGYIIADGFEYDLFISCGIADDIRFEEDFLDNNKIKSYSFDGTIVSFPVHKNNIEWIPKNIGFANTEKTTNLKEYIRNYSNIFLKMDIEGSEFNWIDSMSKEELQQFNQIIIEFHWPFDIYRMNMLKKLNDTHYIIHIHGNNYCDRDVNKHISTGRTYDGTIKLKEIRLPEVFEVTYINKNLINKSLVEMKEIKFPTVLDYPNNKNAKDIHFSIPVHSKLQKNNPYKFLKKLFKKTI